jgi:hypothetical protein
VTNIGKSQLQREPIPGFSVLPQTSVIGGERFPPPKDLDYDQLVKAIYKLIDIWRTDPANRIQVDTILLPQYLNEVDRILQPSIPGIPKLAFVPKLFSIQMRDGERKDSYPPSVRDRLPQAPGPELVTGEYSVLKDDPQYIDNFINEIRDAWYPNQRVFIFQYPNDIFLRIGLPDLLKTLSVSSDLNPKPTEPELRKQYKIPDDFTFAKSSSPSPFIGGTVDPTGTRITIGKATFYRDRESGIIFPQGAVRSSLLPRINDAVRQIESTRDVEELWQRAAPKLLEVITNLEWSAPRGFGTLLVSVAKGAKRAGKAVKNLIIKPQVVHVPEPHVSVPTHPSALNVDKLGSDVNLPASSSRDAITAEEAAIEAKFIDDHPSLVDGSGQRATIGDHEITQLPGGGCERHSGKPISVPCPTVFKRPPAQQAGSPGSPTYKPDTTPAKLKAAAGDIHGVDQYLAGQVILTAEVKVNGKIERVAIPNTGKGTGWRPEQRERARALGFKPLEPYVSGSDLHAEENLRRYLQENKGTVENWAISRGIGGTSVVCEGCYSFTKLWPPPGK